MAALVAVTRRRPLAPGRVRPLPRFPEAAHRPGPYPAPASGPSVRPRSAPGPTPGPWALGGRSALAQPARSRGRQQVQTPPVTSGTSPDPAAGFWEATERHGPNHALLEETEKMSWDKTACKKCGLSFLIFYEFKLLEEKVKAMEKEVKFCEESIEWEKGLQAELQFLYQGLQHYRADSESKTDRIKNLTWELKTKQDELKNVKDDLQYFQEEKEAAYKQSQVLRNTLEHHYSILNKAVSLFPLIRSELDGIKDVISSNLENWAAMKEEIFLQIKTVSKEALTEIPNLNQKLAKSQKENESRQENVKQLTLVADTTELKIQLQTLLQQGSELQSTCHELQKETLDLTNQVETAKMKLQKMTGEMDHYKKLLILVKELKEKEESLQNCQQVCKHLREELAEKERKEEDLKRKNSQSESELEALKALLTQLEEEVVLLKQERELMLISHQKSTEQLQETLRQKMRNEENWKERVETELAKAEAQHIKAILEVKEEVRVELDTERQKQKELITKCQQEYEELQKMIPGLISSATNSLKMETETLEKKLQEAQLKLAEKDEGKEIQSLKRQISELEFQLTLEKNKNESFLADMREEIKHRSDELEKLTQERTQLIHNLNEAQEENFLLQEAVCREREERCELTAAVTRVREEMLELKKLSRYLPFSPRYPARGSRTSSAALPASCGQQSLPGPGGEPGRPGPVGVPRAAKAAGQRGNDGGSPATAPAPTAPRGRAASPRVPRARTAALGRRQLGQL